MAFGDSIFDSLMNSILEKTGVKNTLKKYDNALRDFEIKIVKATKSKIDDDYFNDLVDRGVDDYLLGMIDEKDSSKGYRFLSESELKKRLDEELSVIKASGAVIDEEYMKELVKKGADASLFERTGEEGDERFRVKGSEGEIDLSKIGLSEREVDLIVSKIERANEERYNAEDTINALIDRIPKYEDVEAKKADSKKRDIERSENKQLRDKEIEKRDNFREDLLDSNDKLVEVNGRIDRRLKDLQEEGEGVFRGAGTNNESASDSGGLLDFFKKSNSGGKGAGKFLSRVVKGAGKLAFPLTAAMALWDGVTSGSDDEAILERTGKSEVSMMDRIKQGGAGALAGLVNWFPGLGDINASNTADFFEKSANFLTGRGFSTDKELRSVGREGSSDLERFLSFNPATAPMTALYRVGESLLGSDKNEGNVVLRDQKSVTKSISEGRVANTTSQVVGNKGLSQMEKSMSVEGLSPIINNNTYNTTNVSQETQPRFRITDESTRALSVLGS